jgi:hypothetical protein
MAWMCFIASSLLIDSPFSLFAAGSLGAAALVVAPVIAEVGDVDAEVDEVDAAAAADDGDVAVDGALVGDAAAALLASGELPPPAAFSNSFR